MEIKVKLLIVAGIAACTAKSNIKDIAFIYLGDIGKFQ
jgi:hypothetical protein